MLWANQISLREEADSAVVAAAIGVDSEAVAVVTVAVGEVAGFAGEEAVTGEVAAEEEALEEDEVVAGEEVVE